MKTTFVAEGCATRFDEVQVGQTFATDDGKLWVRIPTTFPSGSRSPCNAVEARHTDTFFGPGVKVESK